MTCSVSTATSSFARVLSSRDMLAYPSESETTTEGLSDDTPIVYVLEHVKSIDFEHMLWMFYNELVDRIVP
jgi:hypothetical protein